MSRDSGRTVRRLRMRGLLEFRNLPLKFLILTKIPKSHSNPGANIARHQTIEH